MADATFTFRVEEDLKEAFAAVAEDGERTAAQLLRLLMRRAIEERRATDEHDAWFRNAVAVGVAEADDSETDMVDDETVADRWARRRDELHRHAAGRTA